MRRMGFARLWHRLARSPDEAVDRRAGAALCAAFAEALAPAAHQAAALVATGGETARALLTRIGARTLDLAGEVEPGVPVSRMADGRPVVTKAGAFGDAGTLCRCRRALRDGNGGIP